MKTKSSALGHEITIFNTTYKDLDHMTPTDRFSLSDVLTKEIIRFFPISYFPRKQGISPTLNDSFLGERSGPASTSLQKLFLLNSGSKMYPTVHLQEHTPRLGRVQAKNQNHCSTFQQVSLFILNTSIAKSENCFISVTYSQTLLRIFVIHISATLCGDSDWSGWPVFSHKHLHFHH